MAARGNKVPVTVYLPAERRDMLKHAAIERGTTVTGLIDGMIDLHTRDGALILPDASAEKSE